MLKNLTLLAIAAFIMSSTALAQRCHEVMAEAADHTIGHIAPFASISSDGSSACESWAFYKVWFEPDGASPKMQRHVVRHVIYRPFANVRSPQISEVDTRTCASIIPAAEMLRQTEVPRPFVPNPTKGKGPITVYLDGRQYIVSFRDLIYDNSTRSHSGRLRFSVHSGEVPFLEDWWRTQAPRLRKCTKND